MKIFVIYKFKTFKLAPMLTLLLLAELSYGVDTHLKCHRIFSQNESISDSDSNLKNKVSRKLNENLSKVQAPKEINSIADTSVLTTILREVAELQIAVQFSPDKNRSQLIEKLNQEFKRLNQLAIQYPEMKSRYFKILNDVLNQYVNSKFKNKNTELTRQNKIKDQTPELPIVPEEINIEMPNYTITKFKFSPDKSKVLIRLRDNSFVSDKIAILDTATGKSITTDFIKKHLISDFLYLQKSDIVLAIRSFSDSNEKSNYLDFYSAKDAKLLNTIPIKSNDPLFIMPIQILASPDESKLFIQVMRSQKDKHSLYEYTQYLYDAKNLKLIAEFTGRQSLDPEWSQDGRYFVYRDHNENADPSHRTHLVVWDQLKQSSFRIKLEVLPEKIFFTPQDKHLVVSTSNSEIKIYELENQTLIKTIHTYNGSQAKISVDSSNKSFGLIDKSRLHITTNSTLRRYDLRIFNSETFEEIDTVDIQLNKNEQLIDLQYDYSKQLMIALTGRDDGNINIQVYPDLHGLQTFKTESIKMYGFANYYAMKITDDNSRVIVFLKTGISSQPHKELIRLFELKSIRDLTQDLD